MAEVRILFRTEDVVVGTFRCPPGDAMWGEENTVGAGHHVVFPRTSVRIEQSGRPGVVADLNQVVLYDDHQTYRRRMVSADGDRCVFVIPSPGLLRSIAGEHGVLPDDGGFSFPGATALTDGAEHLAQHRLASVLMDPRRVDPMAVREGLYDLLGRVVPRALRLRRAARTRAATAALHRDVAEAAREVVSRRFAEHLTLDAIAADVHASPFHLARVFRAETGSTVHAYLTQIRLRTSLEALGTGRTDLAGLAADLGFSSHSHFTESFRRSFGVTPSSLRAGFEPQTV